MELALAFFGLINVVELLIWLPVFRVIRQPAAYALAVGVFISSVWLLVANLKVWTILLVVFGLYRVINLLRLGKARVQADYLYNSALRASVWLIGLQILVLIVTGVGVQNHINMLSYFYILAIVQLGCSLIILASTLRHLKTTRPPLELDGYASRDLPSLTVCIPARNETDSLHDCLESLLSSNYPKLEILVLDDCSQNKRTPEIIRGFAHQGARFLAGKTPTDRWLAKNYAYAQLASEANGELLLFCGVDTRFTQDSLTVLVKTMLKKQKDMISLIPANPMPKAWSISQMLIQPGRYAWELALPRKLIGSPPVLSSCWLITKRALESAGGFEAVTRKAVPESYLARAAARLNDGYSIMQSDARSGVSSLKSLDSQKHTAVRVRYPQLHRRPELVAMTGLTELGLMVWPLLVALAALFSHDWPLAAIAGTAYIIQTVVYSKIVNLTYRKFSFRGLWLLPIAVIYDVGLLNYSMWQYEFREVIWKGRNVCLPIMRVIPSLPKIPS